MHRRQHLRMLSHAQIVVAAPHRDRPGAGTGKVFCLGIRAALTDDIGKHAITPFSLELRQSIAKGLAVRKGHDDSALPGWVRSERYLSGANHRTWPPGRSMRIVTAFVAFYLQRAAKSRLRL